MGGESFVSWGVSFEGDICEDGLETLGLVVWRRLDKGRKPGLEAGGCEGRDVGPCGVVVVLDEVVFA